MIYWKLIVTDQMQCLVMTKTFAPCPMRFNCPVQGDTEKTKSAIENWRVK